MRWAAIRIAVDDGDAGLNNPVGGPSAQAAGDLLIEAGSAGVANDVGARDEVTAVIGYLPEDERLAPRLRQIEAALGLLPVIGVDGVASGSSRDHDPGRGLGERMEAVFQAAAHWAAYRGHPAMGDA